MSPGALGEITGTAADTNAIAPIPGMRVKNSRLLDECFCAGTRRIAMSADAFLCFPCPPLPSPIGYLVPHNSTVTYGARRINKISVLTISPQELMPFAAVAAKPQSQ